MSLTINHNESEFGVGDRVKVTQSIKEGEKKRTQTFEGIVIKIKGRDKEKTFTVRRIGVNQIGIEKIFPINSPTLERVVVSRKGSYGVKRAKLYYIRNKSKKEIEKIYARSHKKSSNKK